MNYQTKKVERIQAVQWTDKNPEEIRDFAGKDFRGFMDSPPLPVVDNGSYHLHVQLGHWLVKRQDGRWKVYTDEQFKELFEPMQVEMAEERLLPSGEGIVESLDEIDQILKEGESPSALSVEAGSSTNGTPSEPNNHPAEEGNPNLHPNGTGFGMDQGTFSSAINNR